MPTKRKHKPRKFTLLIPPKLFEKMEAAQARQQFPTSMTRMVLQALANEYDNDEQKTG